MAGGLCSAVVYVSQHICENVEVCVVAYNVDALEALIHFGRVMKIT